MSERSEVKQDTILKNFWKNNERFADLFNAVVFDGKQVLQPSDLVEVDTDVSFVLRFTESKPLIDYAVKSEKEGGQFNMCEALTKWLEENADKARLEGRRDILTEQIEKKLAKNKSPEEIAEDLEEDISVIREIIGELQ